MQIALLKHVFESRIALRRIFQEMIVLRRINLRRISNCSEGDISEEDISEEYNRLDRLDFILKTSTLVIQICKSYIMYHIS